MVLYIDDQFNEETRPSCGMPEYNVDKTILVALLLEADK
jgi:hypothetical protein